MTESDNAAQHSGPERGQCPDLLFVRPMAYCASIAAATVPRIHSDTVCWLARATDSIRFRSAGLKRIGTMRPLASPFGSLGRPIFLRFGRDIALELLDDCGPYRDRKSTRLNSS